MALRSFWKGSISFGLVNIPVRLYTATEDRPVKFHFLHKKCNSRIQYKKYCPTCKTDVEQEEIVRGYPYTKEQFVIMEEQDFEKASEKLGRVLSQTARRARTVRLEYQTGRVGRGATGLEERTAIDHQDVRDT